MMMRERMAWVAVVAALLGRWWFTMIPGRDGARDVVVARPASSPGVRLTMDALHQQGGVPLGWRLTPPPGNVAAGRESFRALGCGSCHRVAGESFTAADAARGPELTGMGTHHPAAYFVEAILHPDAVLIDAPGYVGSDGRSAMPSYPDLTMGTLADLVAYLGSLQTTLDGRACHASGDTPVAVTMSQLDARQRPIPAVDTGQAFFAQTYEVLPGQLAGLETWFATDGRRAFGRVPGLLRIDTFVDAARPGTAITSSFAFRDETALRNFLGDPTGADLWRQFDGFLGPHGHLALTTPLVYRAPSLSMP